MSDSDLEDADRVVLTMAIAIALAFPVALASRMVQALGGPQLVSRLSERVTFVMAPPLFLIFLVLGTIFLGIATPTEGGAMGALGALGLAGFKRIFEGNADRLNWPMVRSALEQTAKLSAFVLFILIGARIFSLTFYGVDGHKWVEHLLVSLPGGLYGFLIVVNVVVFLLAFFLDFFELAFIVVPLLKPAADVIFRSSAEAIAIAKSIGLTTVTIGGVERVADTTPFVIWLGVMLAVNMQTSFMHPPFGFALMFLRSVAPGERYQDKVTGKTMEPVTTWQIYRGAIPFLAIQLAMVIILVSAPSIVIGKPPAVTERAADANQKAGIIPSDQSQVLNGLALPGTPPPLEGLKPMPPGTPPGASIDFSIPPNVR